MPSRVGVGSSIRSLIRMIKSRARKSPGTRSDPRAGDRIETLERRVLLSHTWFVSTTGNDASTGTLAEPFRTIQRAATIAGYGDTVMIRGGTYRETVHPAQDGITFENYNNETVVVSGADVVGGWSNYRGSIAQASMPWDLGDGNQIFVDGRMINEARFPNTSLDPSHPNLEVAQNIVATGGRGTLYDPHLPGGWSGGVIQITSGDGWYAQSGMITGSGPGWLSFTYTPDQSWTVPHAANHYYLYGKFQALDSPGEWFRDSSGQLYVWTPGSDSPAAHTIEAKHRQFAFDLTGDSNITIEGIGIFAATIKTDVGSSNLVLDHVHASYLSQFVWQNTGWNQPWNSGIALNGANSTVENSVVQFSAGDGIYITAPGALVQNNVVRDVTYNAGDSAGIRDYGPRATISNNLVFDTGRSGILIGAPGSRILDNTVHDVMLLTSDAGGIYAVHQNGGGTEIANNTVYNVHNTQPSPHQTWFAGVGIFLDDNSSNFNVHDNHVTGTDVALKMNYTARGMRVINNALAGSLNSLSGNGQGDWGGSVVTGNVLYGSMYGIGGGAVMLGNSYSGGVPPIHPIPDPPLDSSWVPPAPGSSGGTGSSSGSSGSGRTSGNTGGSAGKSNSGGSSAGSSVPPTDNGDTGPTWRSGVDTVIAGSFDQTSGTAQISTDGSVIVSGGSWLRYSQLNFGSGVQSVRAILASLGKAGMRVQLRLDSPTGKVIGSLSVTGGRRGRAMHLQTARIRKVTGIHDIYLVFVGRSAKATVSSFIFMAPPQKKR